MGAQAYSLTSPPGGAPPALPGVAASAGKAADGGISGGGGKACECFCCADCYWSATLDARGALRRRTKTGRRPARVVAGGAATAGGAAGMDGDKPGDPSGAHAMAGGGRFGVALNGERHAMYAHHVEVLQASYCGKTKA